MKQRLLYLLALCWLLPAMATHASIDRNVLLVPQTVAEPWEETLLPFCLENTCDTATAIQFTMSLPEGVEATVRAGDMTDRLPGHQLSVHKNNDNSYTVMAHSDGNALITGSRGAVFYLKCRFTKTSGMTLIPLTFTDAVLSDIEGKNVLTDGLAVSVILPPHSELMCRPGWANHVVTVGQSVSASFNIVSHSTTRLTDLKVTAAGTSEYCDLTVSTPRDYIDEGEELTVSYTLTGLAATTRTQHLELSITTAEGVSTDFSINADVKEPVPPTPVGVLQADDVPINVSIPIGTTEPIPYTVVLRNTGTAETGPIQVLTAEGCPVSLAMEQPLASLAPGEETELLLSITLWDNAEPGKKRTGTIVARPENCDDLSISYTVTPVETRTGKLTVDVTDDYTIATPDGPHVSGATVQVWKYYGDVLVAQSVTDENGLAVFDELTGGNYRIKVSAPRHKDGKAELFVNVGEDNEKQVYLELAGVEATWDVTQDPVTDEYNVEVKTEVETNIPAPSIDITLPANKPNPNVWFPILVKNKNATPAFDVNFWLETNAECTVEFRKNPYKDKLSAGETLVLYARLVASQLPKVLTLECTANYTYALSGNTKTGKARTKKTYGSTTPGSSGGGGSGGSGGGGGGNNGGNNGGNRSVDPTDNAPTSTKLKDNDGQPTTAKLTIALSQTLTLTRQAFLGTLTIGNTTEVGLEDISLNLTITNKETGAVATDELIVRNLESLETFEGLQELGAAWTLAADATGVAQVRFVPTELAAPEDSVDYVFSGSVTYRFADKEQPLTLELLPQTLTVVPSPRLTLDYFLEPDIMGDDLLTPEEEPQVPAELALLIANRGRGTAQSVTLATEQPRITENIDEVPMVLKISEAWMNGTQMASPTMTMNFGNVEGGQAAHAKWMLSSNLMGRFDEYEVEVNHTSDYPSLIESAQVHELVVKSFEVDEESKLTAFLANDDKDADHWPEALYLSDGTKEAVTIGLTELDEDASTSSEYALNLTAPSDGWVYWRLDDPTEAGELLDIVSDDTDYRFWWWQIYRVYKEGDILKYKREVHILGHPGAGSWNYSLKYDPATTKVASQQLGRSEEWEIGRQTAEGTLTLWGPWSQVASLWVIDAAGRQRQVDGSRERGIDVSQLQPGAYVLRIVSADGSAAAKKFIKTN